jgi:hypothetical protein
MNDTYWRGHKLTVVDNVSFYSDNEKVSDNPFRECGHCRKENRRDGHDSCLGELPGLMNACCGHGDNEPSIQFYDRSIITGKDAKKIIDVLKKYQGISPLNEKLAEKVCRYIGKKLRIKYK